MGAPGLHTPFEDSSDPASYIPRRASETALLGLCSLVRIREPVIVLHGPSGIGKSLLLNVLHERLKDERRVVYASVTSAPAPELCHRILGLLGEPEADDPAEALVAAAHRCAEAGQRILLLIDHASLAPIASSVQLLRAAEAAMPQLSVVFAVADEDGATHFTQALGAEGHISEVAFDRPMNPEEATSYLRQKLAGMDLPQSMLDRMNVDVLSEIASRSHGLPRSLNELANELLTQFGYQGVGDGPPSGNAATTPGTEHGSVPERPTLMSSPEPPRGSLSGSLLHGESGGTAGFSDVARPEMSLGGGLLGPSPNTLRFTPWNESTESPGHDADADGPTSLPDGTDATLPSSLRDGATESQASSAPLAMDADILHEHGIEANHVPATIVPMSELSETELVGPETNSAEAPWERHTSPEPTPPQTRFVLVGLATAAILGGILIGRGLLDESAPEQMAPEPAGAVTKLAAVSSDAPPPEVAPSDIWQQPTSIADRKLTLMAAFEPPTEIAVEKPLETNAVSTPPAPTIESKNQTKIEPNDEAAKSARMAARPDTRPAATAPTSTTAAPAQRAASAAASTAPIAVAAARTPTPAPSPRVERISQTSSPASPAPESSPKPAPERAPVRIPSLVASSGAGSTTSSAAGTPIVVSAPYGSPMDGRPSAYVRVQVDIEPGATLRVDGAEIGVAPLADLLIEPGPHVFAAETAEGLLIEQLVEVGPHTGVIVF